jgi:hypothetical protein
MKSQMEVPAITAKRIAIISAIYAVCCIPAILVAERFDLAEWPMHATQPLAILIMIASGSFYLYQTRGGESSALRKLFYVLCGIGVAWIVLLVWFVFFVQIGPD